MQRLPWADLAFDSGAAAIPSPMDSWLSMRGPRGREIVWKHVNRWYQRVWTYCDNGRCVDCGEYPERCREDTHLSFRRDPYGDP